MAIVDTLNVLSADGMLDLLARLDLATQTGGVPGGTPGEVNTTALVKRATTLQSLLDAPPAAGTTEVEDSLRGGLFRYDSTSTKGTDGGTCFVPTQGLSAVQTVTTTARAISDGFALPHQNVVWGTVELVFGTGVTARTFTDVEQLHGHAFAIANPAFSGARLPDPFNYALGAFVQDPYNNAIGRISLLAQAIGFTQNAVCVVRYKYALTPGRWLRDLSAGFVTPDWWGAPRANPAAPVDAVNLLRWTQNAARDLKLEFFWPAKYYYTGTVERYGRERGLGTTGPVVFPGDLVLPGFGPLDFLRADVGTAPGQGKDPARNFACDFTNHILGNSEPSMTTQDVYYDCNLAQNQRIVTGFAAYGGKNVIFDTVRNAPHWQGLTLTNSSGRKVVPGAHFYIEGEVNVRNSVGSCVLGRFEGPGHLNVGPSLLNHQVYGDLSVGKITTNGYAQFSILSLTAGACGEWRHRNSAPHPWYVQGLQAFFTQGLVFLRGDDGLTVSQTGKLISSYAALDQFGWTVGRSNLDMAGAIDVVYIAGNPGVGLIDLGAVTLTVKNESPILFREGGNGLETRRSGHFEYASLDVRVLGTGGLLGLQRCEVADRGSQATFHGGRTRFAHPDRPSAVPAELGPALYQAFYYPSSFTGGLDASKPYSLRMEAVGLANLAGSAFDVSCATPGGYFIRVAGVGTDPNPLFGTWRVPIDLPGGQTINQGLVQIAAALNVTRIAEQGGWSLSAGVVDRTITVAPMHLRELTLAGPLNTLMTRIPDATWRGVHTLDLGDVDWPSPALSVVGVNVGPMNNATADIVGGLRVRVGRGYVNTDRFVTAGQAGGIAVNNLTNATNLALRSARVDFEGTMINWKSRADEFGDELWMRICHFRDVRVRHSQYGGQTFALLKSEASGIFDYVAPTGGETFVDIPTDLFWRPLGPPPVVIAENGPNVVKVEVRKHAANINEWQHNWDRPVLRCTLAAALTVGQGSTLRYSAAVRPI